MQKLWRGKLQWDESVPQSLFTEWSALSQQLTILETASFERRILIDKYKDVQLHGFCDASNSGYGACIYVRSQGSNGNVRVQLLCSKSRIAPLKTITIPRLELCGAVLLTRLYREAANALGMASCEAMFWCDSTIVLHWIGTSPHVLKPFVANRIAEIQEQTRTAAWRHVRSEDNPADALSRGQTPRAFLRNTLWHTGPAWLIQGRGEWPQYNMPTIEIPELKRNTCLIAIADSFDIWNNYSSYSKLIRIVAYCRRFRPGNKQRGSLNASEIREAEMRIIKLVQAAQFSDVIRRLKERKEAKVGTIANLSPFLDDDGLIRVGGRLQKSALTFAQKHPILLPNRHRLTDAIIRETHKNHHHPGIQTTLCILRQRFWLTDGRNQIRKIIRSCERYRRYDAKALEYKMGNLPAAHVRETFPFAQTGIDYCGPFFIKEKKFRNKNRIKVYVSVFVCMVTKAIHLEVVSDLTSDGFIAALKRFSARHGMPERVYSDNGTNFVGAHHKLRELYRIFNSGEHKITVENYANKNGIEWHFIPPVAPHFGGLWEASVKLFKHHFKRVVGDSLFTFEELNTFVIEVEGILNSRPITTLSSDPNDSLVLTPAHYLVGRPITALPEGDLSAVSVNRLSTWQHISKVRQDFWARWSLEYLNELQVRAKWTKDSPQLNVGMLVLIKDKNLACAHWVLGRISQLHPGEDGIVRAATIRTAHGDIKRATNRLCPLPVEQQPDNDAGA